MNKIFAFTALAMFSVSNFAYSDEAAAKALDKECAAAREAKLKPLRDAEIERCKNESHKDASYCERYWSDYGDAKRLPNGNMQPRMFNDLPECIAAEEARRKK